MNAARPSGETATSEPVEPYEEAGLGTALHRLLASAARELDVDMAQVLLLDPAGVLEVAASYGMGRVGRSSLRVRVGQGFAGSIAEARRPVVVTDVNERTVLDPVLRQLGPSTLLGVPLMVQHELVGVLHVGSRAPRAFAVDDIVVLERLAQEMVSVAVSRQHVEEVNAALLLQRSLMPVLGAPIAALDIAARYVPAEGELGGDWYDVFSLPGDRLGLVIGDVAGHGLRAAIVMGRLRSALRAYALDTEDPAEVLAKLDRKLSHFESGTMATVLYVVAAAPYDTLTISSAGHWPPFLIKPGHEAEQLAINPDPVLGTGEPFRRSATSVSFPPGASLCLFTDGLVDRRPRPGTDPMRQLDQRLEHVRRSLNAGDDAETTCTRVLLDALGDDVNEDDTALLVVRRP